ncbi:MAG: hypothetical protein L3J65_07930 [Robiginitomaculum sp.]|nr:hypothetical protein [Robiginitomaculum sp.]
MTVLSRKQAAAINICKAYQVLMSAMEVSDSGKCVPPRNPNFSLTFAFVFAKEQKVNKKREVCYETDCYGHWEWYGAWWIRDCDEYLDDDSGWLSWEVVVEDGVKEQKRGSDIRAFAVPHALFFAGGGA